MPAIDLPRAAGWRKSSHSGGNEGGSNCVEVRCAGTGIGVRDSKNPGSGAIAVSPAEWRTFVTALKDSRLLGA